MNKDNLGQVFTRADIVDKMIELRSNTGRVLEPSCGDGAFFHKLDGCVGIEYDSKFCPPAALNMDFFDYPQSEKFDTIIGNPPYVKWSHILDTTKKSISGDPMFDERSNLYLFFIKKCVQHLNDGGELIFRLCSH